jgi:hypothetical protein
MASADSSSGAAAAPARVLTQEEIQDVFEYYANFGRSTVMNYQDSLDSFMLCVPPPVPPPRASANARWRVRARARPSGRRATAGRSGRTRTPCAAPVRPLTHPPPSLRRAA